MDPEAPADAEGSKRGEGGKRSTNPNVGPNPCVMKFLAPEALAAAIIGKGGSVIASMRTSCQAKIALTEHGDVYPATECRVLTAQAASEDLLNEVARQIIVKLAELVKGATSGSDAIGYEGEMKLRVVVPRAAGGGVIGKGGAVIKQLRESSKAKISISEPSGSGPAAEQLITVQGTAEAIEQVLTEVNKQIQLLKMEAWFSTWSMSSNTTGSMGVALNAAYAGMGRGHGGHPGVDLMMRVARTMPQHVLEDSRGFALSCTVPSKLVGGLIGRGGAGTKEVQTVTGTRINIRDIEADPDNRTLNIQGPLPNTCAAYMMMMQRYLDAESTQASR